MPPEVMTSLETDVLVIGAGGAGMYAALEAARAGANVILADRSLMALASALQKLQDYSKVRPMQVNPAVSHLFIVNPLGKVDFGSLFSTHPATDKRIARLNQIARQTGDFS